MKEAELPRPQNRPDATRPAALLLHGPAEPVVPRVLDSPHSGAVFPPDVASALSELDLREDEDAFVDHSTCAKTKTRSSTT